MIRVRRGRRWMAAGEVDKRQRDVRYRLADRAISHVVARRLFRRAGRRRFAFRWYAPSVDALIDWMHSTFNEVRVPVATADRARAMAAGGGETHLVEAVKATALEPFA